MTGSFDKCDQGREVYQLKVLAVIPAYNEEENIESVIERLQAECPEVDYVIVNDGSADRTEEICRARGYRMVSLPINLGLAGAVQASMKYAMQHDYDAAVQFDADGQHRPEYIAPLLARLNDGYDIVIGSRFVTQRKPFTLRMVGSYLISGAIRLTTGKTIKDPTSGMRIYNRTMIRELATRINCAPEPDTISSFISRGARVDEIQVTMDERIAGTSYLNISRSIGYMLRVGVSILLLQRFRGGARFHDKEANV